MAQSGCWSTSYHTLILGKNKEELGPVFYWLSPSARDTGKCSFSAEHIIQGLVHKEEWENGYGVGD